MNYKKTDMGNTSFFNRKDNQYLFGMMPYGKNSKEDYSRYIFFMKCITDVLKEFGIHINNNGYSYIIDAVMVIIDLRTLDIRLNNDVYPYVALKYDYKKYTAIEHNIRNAIKTAFQDNQKNPGINKMDLFEKRPTNKQFLFYVAESVCKTMYEEMMVA